MPLRAPRGGLRATLLPGVTYHFWADVAIPKGTFEGVYTTEIELLSGDVTVGGVNVELTVWPIILPDESAIPLVAELDHRQLFLHAAPNRYRAPTPGVDDWRQDPMRSELDALLTATLRSRAV